VLAQVATAEAAADWRHQVAPHEVPPGARALGTQEGTNAHLLARRMKRRGCSWSVGGARAMAKARELVTNRTLAAWCLRALPPRSPTVRHITEGVSPRLPWPAVSVPAARGPARDATVAHLQRVLAGGYRH
jgi:hypothetical protein